QTEEAIEMRRLAAALRAREERLQRLSDAAFEGIAIHDGSGLIVESNAAFARLFGYAPPEVAGRSAFDLVDPDDHVLVRDRLLRPQDEPYEVRGRRKDGSRFDLEITARDFPYEGRAMRVVAVRDVTERKRAERALLEKAALQATNDRLREIDAMKTQFINNAAHELGTPLTPIKLQAHLLRSDAALTAKQRRSVDVLNRNVDHLSLMVRDLLDASRLQAGRLSLEPRPVDVARLVEEAAESFAEAARQAGVDLRARAEGPLVVKADAPRVTQVLLNLVGNALKFTPAGGSIEVSAQREGDEVVLRVRDTGAGLSEDQIERLFRPFSQVHDRTGLSHGGTGLGLFISRGVAEQHGGRIWASAEGPGLGSTCGFALPSAGSAPWSGVQRTRRALFAPVALFGPARPGRYQAESSRRRMRSMERAKERLRSSAARCSCKRERTTSRTFSASKGLVKKFSTLASLMARMAISRSGKAVTRMRGMEGPFFAARARNSRPFMPGIL